MMRKNNSPRDHDDVRLFFFFLRFFHIVESALAFQILEKNVSLEHKKNI